ncbi:MULTISPECIES: tetratricopeptide repeat protein [Cyanophyceae]|uniref:Tetratricopeptide repeat protein n=1 Tax=Leptolyngbya subtilissima DQ-A4 TaxID=2933933 RepID=A0ABV0K1N8_9CYAN|nr:tetratricopeptide repeat protein [Nodosilinea sp. FACHB-141]MBD2112514.1 tetratricopeptide repeat protein [Nodosilinea sp. FACHB-141]
MNQIGKKHIGKLGLALGLMLLVGQAAPAANLEEQLDLRPSSATQGESRDVADGWMQLGNQQLAEGNLTQAVDSWAEAAEIYRLLGDGQSAGRAYGSMGAAFATLDRYPEAERAFVLRIGTARDNDDLLGQVYGLNNLGNLYINQGRLNEGQAHFEEALQIARTSGDSRAIGVSLSNLGQVATQRGDLDVAVQLLEAATNYRILASDYLGEAHSSNSLGDVYVALGRDSNAIGAYRVGLRAGVDAGDRNLQIRALDGLIGIYLERDDLVQAKGYLDQRAALTLGTVPPDLQTALSYRSLGDYYLLVDDRARAEQAFTLGLQIARDLQQKSLEAEFINRLLEF